MLVDIVQEKFWSNPFHSSCFSTKFSNTLMQNLFGLNELTFTMQLAVLQSIWKGKYVCAVIQILKSIFRNRGFGGAYLKSQNLSQSNFYGKSLVRQHPKNHVIHIKLVRITLRQVVAALAVDRFSLDLPVRFLYLVSQSDGHLH